MMPSPIDTYIKNMPAIYTPPIFIILVRVLPALKRKAIVKIKTEKAQKFTLSITAAIVTREILIFPLLRRRLMV